MKITIRSAYDEEDCIGGMTISVDNKHLLRFCDGEPEDNNICRNFNDVYRITDLIALVFDAAARGDNLEVESMDVDWSEL